MIIHKPVSDNIDGMSTFKTYVLLRSFSEVSSEVTSNLYTDKNKYTFSFKYTPNNENIALTISIDDYASFFKFDYSICLYNQNDKKMYFKKNLASMTFTTNIHQQSIVICKKGDLNNDLIAKDELVFFVIIKYAVIAKTNNFINTDIPPFQGILNSNLNCYINSVLQLFFHIPQFRKLIYSLPSEKSGFYRQLQVLFCWLQIGTTPTVKYLLESINEDMGNWDAYRFILFMLDAFPEKKEKISNIFYYSIKQKTHLIPSENVTEKIEYSSVFIVNTQGHKSLEDSLLESFRTEYLIPKTLEEGTLKKEFTQKFSRLPKIMIIYTNRISYTNKGAVKLNHSFEFPKKIDLGQYLEVPSNHPYFLYGVITHSGNANAGHYMTYLKCNKGRWVLFDDSRVTYTYDHVVIDENFSGASSAAMLVYVSDDYEADIFEKLTEKDIPAHIKEDFAEIRKKYELEEEQHNTLTFNILRNSDFEDNSELGLPVRSKSCEIKIPSKSQVQDLIRSVSSEFQMFGNFRLWSCQDNIPNCVVRTNLFKSSLENLKVNTLFLEKIEGENHICNLSDNDILVLVKFYENRQILFLFEATVNAGCEINVLRSLVLKCRPNISENTELIAFGEKDECLSELDMEKTFANQEICFSGKIIIFQQKPSENDRITTTTFSSPSLTTCDVDDSSTLFTNQLLDTAKNFIDRKYRMKEIEFCQQKENGAIHKTLRFPLTIPLDNLKIFVSVAFKLDFNISTDQMFFFPQNSLVYFESEKTAELVQKSNKYTFFICRGNSGKEVKPLVAAYYEGSHFQNKGVVFIENSSSKAKILSELYKNEIIPSTDFYRIFVIAFGSIKEEITTENNLDFNSILLKVYKETKETSISDESTEALVLVKYANFSGKYIDIPFFFKLNKGEIFGRTYERLALCITDIEKYDFILKTIKFEALLKKDDEPFSMIECQDNFIIARMRA